MALALMTASCQASTSLVEAPAVEPTATASSSNEAAAPEATSPGATATPTAELEPTPAPPPTATVGAPTPVPAAAPTPSPVGVTEEMIQAAVATSSLEERGCPIFLELSRVRCLSADLPLRYESPDDGDRVRLRVAVIDNGDPVGAGPVVFLQGGPGVSAVDGARRFVGTNLDLVVFDQRGVGGSRPALACPEVDELWVAERLEGPTFDDERFFEAYAACAERLVAEGIDLDAFNTSAVAADVEVLRRLLGHAEWSLWGSSYGTRVGLTIMRDHPDGLRAAVLDSVVPFEVDFFGTLGEHAARSFEALDTACDADRCVTDHGDFADNLVELTLALEESPVTVITTRPASGDDLEVLVSGSELLEVLFTQMYRTRALPAIPRQIDRHDFGGLDELVAGFVAGRDPQRLDLAIGVYYSTWCREEYPFHDPDIDDAYFASMADRYGQPFADVFADTFDSDDIGRLCAIFDVEPAPVVDDRPLTSSIPTLVFAGAFDPITPPAWSRQVADALGNATFVELADHGHGMISRCAGQLQIDFLTDPDRDLDLSCAEATGPPDFD